MAILRIKDADGNVTEVLALRGEPGKSGVLTVNGVAPDENGNVNVDGGGGLTSAEKSLLLSLFKNAAYTADMSAIIAQLETLWGGGDVPELPEADVSQTGSVLSIVSGVTASQSGSVLAIA